MLEAVNGGLTTPQVTGSIWAGPRARQRTGPRSAVRNLDKNTPYVFQVRAHNRIKASESGEASATTLGLPIAPFVPPEVAFGGLGRDAASRN